MIDVRNYFAIYNAIICKEADYRLNVFVDVVDVQQEGYRSQVYVTSVMPDRAPSTETRCLRFDRKDVIEMCVLPDQGLYQKLWQYRGELHQFVFCYPMPSSSHGLYY